MKAKVLSGALQGVDAYHVEVEVDLISSLPMFSTVGLAEGAVRESKERVRSAIKNSGFAFPLRRITVNLAPAGIPKDGTAFDLPIAIGILLESGAVQPDHLNEYMLVGELSLDGRLRPIRGALSIATAVQRAGLKGLILPEENALEAAVVAGIEVRPAASLLHVVEFLNGKGALNTTQVDLEKLFDESRQVTLDLQDVRGHSAVKRAMEVAAAGGHNLLMIGPPGSGKTMLARRLPSILPPLSFAEAIETTKIYSVIGRVSRDQALVVGRPFRAPHHTISEAGLIGGGSPPTPGEISLSHNGVLFLDEMPEFRRKTLEVLRQPLEDGHVSLARAKFAVTYPARVMLVATMNPCPCGHLGDSNRHCRCSPMAIAQYRSRISGPLLDRIDLHIEVPSVRFHELDSNLGGENSASMKSRVCQAREIQRKRYASQAKNSFASAFHNNAQLTSKMLHQFCQPDAAGRRLLEIATERLGLSARAYTRILKVARTIADLEDYATVKSSHIAEAVQYRMLDRPVNQPERPADPSPSANFAEKMQYSPN